MKCLDKSNNLLKQSSILTKQLTKKLLIDKISMKLLVLKIRSDSMIKSRSEKYILKNILSDYE